jgi:hypothetical protein
VRVIPDPHGASSQLEFDLDKFDAGNGLVSHTVIFDDHPQASCLRGTGLLSVTPGGVVVIFPRRRAELPFVVDEQAVVGEGRASLVFGTPTCRLKIEVEKDVRQGDAWVRLAPVDWLNPEKNKPHESVR